MKKRGPHPQDLKLFSATQYPLLKRATTDLSWLLSRKYSKDAAMKIVGDSYALRKRQREAVGRCSFSKQQIAKRKRTNVGRASIKNKVVYIDGFNILTTIEAALGKGVLIKGHDGVIRDMASMHGTYRILKDTKKALEMLGISLENWGVKEAVWYLDRPVSNSGRLKKLMEEIAEAEGFKWRVEVVKNPDTILLRKKQIIMTADSGILDNISKWFNITEYVLRRFNLKGNLHKL
jgi:hypothetical protein